MAEEEEKLLEARENEKAAVKLDPNFKFDKLDELLTQTKLYSEFLLEKMDDITAVSILLKIHDACAFLSYHSVWLSRMQLRTRLRKKIL